MKLVNLAKQTNRNIDILRGLLSNGLTVNNSLEFRTLSVQMILEKNNLATLNMDHDLTKRINSTFFFSM